MIVTMTVHEVIEACKEWLKKHHNVSVPEAQGGFIKNHTGHSIPHGDHLNDIQVTFDNIEKPPAVETPYRG